MTGDSLLSDLQEFLGENFLSGLLVVALDIFILFVAVNYLSNRNPLARAQQEANPPSKFGEFLAAMGNYRLLSFSVVVWAIHLLGDMVRAFSYLNG